MGAGSRVGRHSLLYGVTLGLCSWAQCASGGKHIDWYCGSCNAEFATNASNKGSRPALVDGIMPCCNLLEIDCKTGQINVSAHNFSGYKPFLQAGKSVNVDLSGEAACCASKDDCTILEHKEQLAQQLLTLAQTYNLSGYTQDWEFGQAFYWCEIARARVCVYIC